MHRNRRNGHDLGESFGYYGHPRLVVTVALHSVSERGAGVVADGFVAEGALAVVVLGLTHHHLRLAVLLLDDRLVVDALALVLGEVVLPPVSLVAVGARERFLVGVDLGVRLELVRVGELLRASAAFVRPFSGVHPYVSPQVRHLHE